MYLVLGMLNKTPSDREEPNFAADSLSSPSSRGYSEFTDCTTVCERQRERRAGYQSALNLKVIRILQFSLKPCRKMQRGGGDGGGGGGGDRLIEE